MSEHEIATLAKRWAADDENRDLVSAGLTEGLATGLAELNTRVTAIASWISDLLSRIQVLEKESAERKNNTKA